MANMIQACGFVGVFSHGHLATDLLFSFMEPRPTCKENLMVVGLHAPSVVATERTSHSHLGLDVFLDLCMFRWDFMRPRLGGRDISSAWGYTEGAQHVMQTSSGGLAFFLQHPPKPARHLVRSRTRKHA